MAVHSIAPTPNPPPPSLSFDANNHISGGSYDAAGDLAEDPATGCTFTYDAENRLSSVSGCNAASYTYNAQGQREHITVNGVVREDIYGQAGEARTVFAGQSQLVQGELYFNGEHLATYANGTTYFDHADRLGTERARTNLSGGVVESYTSLPYGGWLNQVGTISAAHFLGQPFDGESSLSYLGARSQSGYVGRFLTPDDGSAQNPNDGQSWNLYSYARDNPTTLADPDGRDETICVGQPPGPFTDCWDVSDNAYDSLAAVQNKQGGVVMPTGQFPTGDIYCGDVVCGTVQYHEPGLKEESLNLFIYGDAVASLGRSVVAGITDLFTGAAAGASIETAVTTSTRVLGEVGAGTAGATVAEVDAVAARAIATAGDQSITVSSREVAEQAAREFVGPGAQPIRAERGSGEIIGEISADSSKVARWTSAGKPEPYINLENRAIGGNLHVYFPGP